eukprot:128388_1
MSDFEVDKHLKQFVDELTNAGFSIQDIGSALRDEPQARKETNWNAVAKKETLDSFVEIYTVILSIIVYALKSKQISYKPSQKCIKALTIKLSAKLPKRNDKAVLTQSYYMTSLHNIFHQIHDEINSTVTIDINDAKPEPGDVDDVDNEYGSNRTGFNLRHLFWGLRRVLISCVILTACIIVASYLIHDGSMKEQAGEEYAEAGASSVLWGTIFLVVALCCCYVRVLPYVVPPSCGRRYYIWCHCYPIFYVHRFCCCSGIRL